MVRLVLNNIDTVVLYMVSIEIESIRGLEAGKSYVFEIAKSTDADIAMKAIHRFATQGNFRALVVQEGGYDTRVLGINARHFFTGLWSGTYTL